MRTILLSLRDRETICDIDSQLKEIFFEAWFQENTTAKDIKANTKIYNNTHWRIRDED